MVLRNSNGIYSRKVSGKHSLYVVIASLENESLKDLDYSRREKPEDY